MFLAVLVVGQVVLGGLLSALGLLPMLLADPEFGQALQFGLDPGGFSASEYAAVLAKSPQAKLVALYSTLGSIITCIFYCHFMEKRNLTAMGLGIGAAGALRGHAIGAAGALRGHAIGAAGALRGYAIGFLTGVLMLTASLAICLLTGTLEYHGLNPSIPWALLAAALGGFVIQGASEELLFRGQLLVSLARSQSLVVAVGISSLLFSLLHTANPGSSPLALVNLFLFAVFAAVYFLKRGDIWGIAAFHTAWNFAQGSLYGTTVSGFEGFGSVFNFVATDFGSLLNGGDFGLEGGLAVSVVLLAGTITLLFLTRERVS